MSSLYPSPTIKILFGHGALVIEALVIIVPELGKKDKHTGCPKVESWVLSC